MSNLVWEEPPVKNARSNVHAEVAAALKARPGEWAVVSDMLKTSSSATINNGGAIAYRPAGSFESVTRVVDGEKKVYARYIGERR